MQLNLSFFPHLQFYFIFRIYIKLSPSTFRNHLRRSSSAIGHQSHSFESHPTFPHWSCSPPNQRCQGYQKTAFCSHHISAGIIQHRSSPFPSHFRLCNHRHVPLRTCQNSYRFHWRRRIVRNGQFPDFRQQHGPPFPSRYVSRLERRAGHAHVATSELWYELQRFAKRQLRLSHSRRHISRDIHHNKLHGNH